MTTKDPPPQRLLFGQGKNQDDKIRNWNDKGSSGIKTWSYSILENRPDAISSIPFGSARLERGVGHNVKRYNRTPGPGTNVVHRMESSSMGVWCRWSFFFSFVNSRSYKLDGSPTEFRSRHLKWTSTLAILLLLVYTTIVMEDFFEALYCFYPKVMFVKLLLCSLCSEKFYILYCIVVNSSRLGTYVGPSVSPFVRPVYSL
jgi:hypothetical protein